MLTIYIIAQFVEDPYYTLKERLHREVILGYAVAISSVFGKKYH